MDIKIQIMKNILIFKTDRLGDLLNISPIISNLKSNFPSCNITLICSKYNQSIVKYYNKDLNFIVFDEPLFFFLFKNMKSLLFKRYDFILQLDGKNNSYLASIFIRANKKACIKFIKNKLIFGKSFLITRPNFFINNFFDYTEISRENYNLKDNINYHYLTLYFNLIKKLNVKILSKNHYLPFDDPLKVSSFIENYYLFHIDKRWDLFSKSVGIILKEKIILFSQNKNIVISSNIGGNQTFSYLKNKLHKISNIEFISDSTLHDTISLVYFSDCCISSHSGLIVHSAAAFKKRIIDIVPKDIFNELDRWIPFNTDYKRINIENLANENFDI